MTEDEDEDDEDEVWCSKAVHPFKNLMILNLSYQGLFTKMYLNS